MQHFCVYITLFDKLLQTIKLVCRGLRTVYQITASDDILSSKKLFDIVTELFGHTMQTILWILISVFLLIVWIFFAHFDENGLTAAKNGVACGPDGVMRPQTTLRLSSVSKSENGEFRRQNTNIKIKFYIFWNFFYSISSIM